MDLTVKIAATATRLSGGLRPLEEKLKGQAAARSELAAEVATSLRGDGVAVTEADVIAVLTELSAAAADRGRAALESGIVASGDPSIAHGRRIVASSPLAAVRFQGDLVGSASRLPDWFDGSGASLASASTKGGLAYLVIEGASGAKLTLDEKQALTPDGKPTSRIDVTLVEGGPIHEARARRFVASEADRGALEQILTTALGKEEPAPLSPGSVVKDLRGRLHEVIAQTPAGLTTPTVDVDPKASVGATLLPVDPSTLTDASYEDKDVFYYPQRALKAPNGDVIGMDLSRGAMLHYEAAGDRFTAYPLTPSAAQQMLPTLARAAARPDAPADVARVLDYVRDYALGSEACSSKQKYAGDAATTLSRMEKALSPDDADRLARLSRELGSIAGRGSDFSQDLHNVLRTYAATLRGRHVEGADPAEVLSAATSAAQLGMDLSRESVRDCLDALRGAASAGNAVAKELAEGLKRLADVAPVPA